MKNIENYLTSGNKVRNINKQTNKQTNKQKYNYAERGQLFSNRTSYERGQGLNKIRLALLWGALL